MKKVRFSILVFSGLVVGFYLLWSIGNALELGQYTVDFGKSGYKKTYILENDGIWFYPWLLFEAVFGLIIFIPSLLGVRHLFRNSNDGEATKILSLSLIHISEPTRPY